MNIVRESISFTRGNDPKEILGIGFPMDKMYDALYNLSKIYDDLSNIKEYKASNDEMGYSIESLEINRTKRKEVWMYILCYNNKSRTYFLSGKELFPDIYHSIMRHEFTDIMYTINELKKWIRI